MNTEMNEKRRIKDRFIFNRTIDPRALNGRENRFHYFGALLLDPCELVPEER
jgi:hypothetical protein